MSLPLICDLSRDELAAWCQAQGEQGYRADQIRKWIFGKRVLDFESMTDLSAGLRKRLAQSFALIGSRAAQHQKSRDGTEKLLVELADGEKVECVLMREDDRRTICISTQVGCGMGCVFCASGLLGLSRNLSAGEIVEQILRLHRLFAPPVRVPNHVSLVMGAPARHLPPLAQPPATP